MISSNNLLMFYLALELSTIPLAALANFDLGKRRSSEAAFRGLVPSARGGADREVYRLRGQRGHAARKTPWAAHGPQRAHPWEWLAGAPARPAGAGHVDGGDRGAAGAEDRGDDSDRHRRGRWRGARGAADAHDHRRLRAV